MFAVFKSGGKQYKVQENQVLKLEKLDAAVGEEIKLEEIMMMGENEAKVSVGAPYVKNASVTIQVVDQDKDPKVIIFKKKRRKNYRRKTGHRQPISLVKVISITVAK
jgi:large subunit ribosomal protein L21